MELHEIVHRDIKLDNVLLDEVGHEQNERAVLTDFGMCLDCRAHAQLPNNAWPSEGFRVELRFDGYRLGGAAIALAPEITLPRPGPGVFLDYSKNDAWACGIVLH
eukprot:SAG31_NODE_21891_length_538_cov_1.125285_1_plen_104_part_10